MLEQYLDQFARQKIERDTLEAAAKRIEEERGSSVYESAWRRAARIIRSLKPD